jgi:histidinol-phosphate phosphatase family protein
MTFDVVIPTVGRPSLQALLERLASLEGPQPGRIIVVSDGGRLNRETLPAGVVLLPGAGRGPAAARNIGWRVTDADWVAFLDDDVLPEPDWLQRLETDLDVPPDVAASQGRIRVPLPADRRPTDWERNVHGLERARYATADMAYRRSVLAELGGFDERFRRAFREDADLALRALNRGYGLETGAREVRHPVRATGFWMSVALQAGNADDALMWALHGPSWRERAEVRPGRRRRHLAVTGAGVVALGALLAGRRRAAAIAGAAWLAGTVELAWRRIAPGPRTAGEVVRMAATSAAIPAAATYHWLAGWARLPQLLGEGERARPAAVLLDRDGTLVEDVPYNGDPDRVVAVAGAREALDRLRAAGLPLAVISNQSGVARGLVTGEQVEAVNRRVEQLVGPVDTWLYCPHGPEDGCGCRKPRPGMIVDAASELGVDAARCAVVGDIGADVEAARAAGARGVLVPTSRTLREEIDAAPEVARDLHEAVDLLLGRAR